MNRTEALSAIFNRVAERHSLIKEIEERTLFPFMTENTYLEVRCIELISQLERPNVTKLAQIVGVTRGAVSKTIKGLVERGAIETYQSAGNKKEIYYRLTESGLAIQAEHEAMHHVRIERDRAFFGGLDDDEQEQLTQLLSKVYGQIAKKLTDMGLDTYV